MAKKEQETKVEKGNRITGKKASAESYIPFYEFLLFEPKYREMKDKAKILYSFLRKKTADNKRKYADYLDSIDNGETPSRGTESYLDENNEIFCLADNAELAIILQCHPNRVKDQRDELKLYGLLEEVPRFNHMGHKLSSAWYVLEPNIESLSERWTHIEEMKELRTKLKEENQKKKEKHLAKRNVEKTTQKADGNKSSETNQQNVSRTNQQNVSWTNQQNVSKNKSKGFKSKSKGFKSTFNLSINEEVEKAELPIKLKQTLINKIDRLIEFNIQISDIDLHFNANKDTYKEAEYSFVLNNLLLKMEFSPDNFAAVMDNWLQRNRKKLNDLIAKAKEKDGPIRKEMLPEWFNEDEYKKVKPAVEQNEVDLEQKKQELEDMLKRLRA